MFWKKYKLKKRDFEKVIKCKKKINNSLFLIFFIKNDLEENRFGISIPRKIIKKKILRNYYKRQVKNMIINFLQKKKESIKKNKKNNYDSIIIPRSFFFKNSFLLNQLSLFKLLLFHLSH